MEEGRGPATTQTNTDYRHQGERYQILTFKLFCTSQYSLYCPERSFIGTACGRSRALMKKNQVLPPPKRLMASGCTKYPKFVIGVNIPVPITYSFFKIFQWDLQHLDQLGHLCCFPLVRPLEAVEAISEAMEATPLIIFRNDLTTLKIGLNC